MHLVMLEELFPKIWVRDLKTACGRCGEKFSNLPILFQAPKYSRPIFACGQVSSPRLYRLWLITYETNYKNKINQTFNWIFLTYWNSDSRSPTIADDVLLSSWICSVPFPENFDRSTGVTWLVEFFLARTSDININIHFIWSKNLSWENWSNADYNLTASERREKKCAQMVSTKPIIIYNKTADKNYK